MKIFKSILALAIVMSLAFVSCSKSDDDSNDFSSPIVGKWEPAVTYGFDQKDIVVSTELADHSEGCDKDYIEFVSNGTGNDVYYDYDCEVNVYKFTWKVNGDKITIVSDGVESGILTYKITGEILEMSRTLRNDEHGDYGPSVVKIKTTFKKK